MHSRRHRVHLRMVRSVAAAIAAVLALPSVAQGVETPPLPARIIDVVQVTWLGAPTPAASAESVAQTIQTDTIERWRTISNGRIVFTFGRVLAPVQTRIQMPCDGAGSVEYMNAVQLAAYQRDGITGWDSRYLVILSPRPSPDCVWDGRGIVNPTFATSGRLILKDTDDPTVIAHELGHNLGLGHSNFERCKNGKPDGPWQDCTAVEYGSATDLMGNNDRTSPLNAYHQWRMGWIPDSDVASGNRNSTVTLRPVDNSEGTRALFIRDGSAAYWVELRRRDPENGIDAGLVIYRSDPPPGTSVESPIASDRSDIVGTAVTTDVWMISLGTYTYFGAPGRGSPSLPPGAMFTTAYGGATISASENLDGSALVKVVRNNISARPATPVLTDPNTWDSPTTEILDAAVDDTGAAIVAFEARVTTPAGTRVVGVPARASTTWQRTFLNPVVPPTTVVLKDLPEGKYRLQLRAIDALGATSNWSESVDVTIDLDVPVVKPVFRAVGTGDSIALEWVGATDVGSGVCRAQILNPEGFATQTWSDTTPGAPAFSVTSTTRIDGRALVHDCQGNGVIGEVRLATQRIAATEFSRQGRWSKRANGDLQCVGACTATLLTPEGASTSIVVRTSATLQVFQDGKRIQTLKKTKQTKPRTVFIAKGPHRVRLSGSDFQLSGAVAVVSEWQQTGVRALRVPTEDVSLNDARQVELAKIGLNQLDVIDDLSVLPLNGGTGIIQGTLDLCSDAYPSEELRIARRQVVVSNADRRYSFISSETVRYRSSDAVRQALREIDVNVANCKRDGGAVSSTGAVQPYEFLELPALPRGLVPEADRRVYLVNIGEGEQRTTLLVVYQFRSNLLNALYVAVDGPNLLTIDEQLRWLQIAERLADRLRKA